jgi:hypothetical protein
MKLPMIVGMMAFTCLVESSLAQTTKYAPFPGNETIQSKLWHQISGCKCGIGKGPPDYPESFRQHITLAPTAVGTPPDPPVAAGKPIQIRYDASVLCNGQGFLDSNGVDFSKPNFGGVGTVTWEPGVIQTLPNLYGIITFSGYKQPTNDSIAISISVQCVDTGSANCRTTCPISASIPVNVARKKTKAGGKTTDQTKLDIRGILASHDPSTNRAPLFNSTTANQ